MSLIAWCTCFLTFTVLHAVFYEGVEDKQQLFELWSAEYGKLYASGAEAEHRKNVLWENYQLVKKMRSSGLSFEVGLNGYADLTDEEFEARFASGNVLEDEYQSVQPDRDPSESQKSCPRRKIDLATLPQKVDWKEKGYVGEIKDQLHCASCYAFAGIAAVESAWAIKSGKLTLFSEQQIVDCGNQFDNSLKGCDFSNIKASFKFHREVGVWTLEDRPYYGVQRPCPGTENPFAKVSGQESDIWTEAELLENVSKGPTTIGMEMNASVRWYESGVLDVKGPCGFRINHLVVVYGYNLEAAKPYFSIKNSWGTIWGNKGYMDVRLLGGETRSMCGWIGSWTTRPYFN